MRAGNTDTTAGVIGYAFHHFAGHPEHRRLLIDDASRIELFIEEVLRYYSVVATARVVRDDDNGLAQPAFRSLGARLAGPYCPRGSSILWRIPALPRLPTQSWENHSASAARRSL